MGRPDGAGSNSRSPFGDDRQQSKGLGVEVRYGGYYGLLLFFA